MDKAKTFAIGYDGAHLKSKSSKFEDKLESEEDGEDDVEGVEESGVQLKIQIFIICCEDKVRWFHLGLLVVFHG